MPIDVTPVDTGVTAPDMTQQAAAVEQGVSAAAMSAIPQAIQAGVKAGTAYKDAKAEKSVDLAIGSLLDEGVGEPPLAGADAAQGQIERLMRSQAQFRGGSGGVTGMQTRINQVKASVLAANPGREAEVHRYFDSQLSSSGIQSAVDYQIELDKEDRKQAAAEFDQFKEVGIAAGVEAWRFSSPDANEVAGALAETIEIQTQNARLAAIAHTAKVNEPEARRFVRENKLPYYQMQIVGLNSTIASLTQGRVTDIRDTAGIAQVALTDDLDGVRNMLTEAYMLSREADIDRMLSANPGFTREMILEERGAMDATIEAFIDAIGTENADKYLNALIGIKGSEFTLQNPGLHQLGMMGDLLGDLMNVQQIQAQFRDAGLKLTEGRIADAMASPSSPGNYPSSVTRRSGGGAGEYDYRKTQSTTQILNSIYQDELPSTVVREVNAVTLDTSWKTTLSNPDADLDTVAVALDMTMKGVARYKEEFSTNNNMLDRDETDKILRNLTSPAIRRFAQERPAEFNTMIEPVAAMINVELSDFTKSLVGAGATQFPLADLTTEVQERAQTAVEGMGQAQTLGAAGGAPFVAAGGMRLAQIFSGATETTPQDVEPLAMMEVPGVGARPYTMADVIKVVPTVGPVSELQFVVDKVALEDVKAQAGERWTPAVEAELNSRVYNLNVENYQRLKSFNELANLFVPSDITADKATPALAQYMTEETRRNAHVQLGTEAVTAEELQLGKPTSPFETRAQREGFEAAMNPFAPPPQGGRGFGMQPREYTGNRTEAQKAADFRKQRVKKSGDTKPTPGGGTTDKVYYGSNAVEIVRLNEPNLNLTPAMERVIELEGYVDETYLDKKGIPTVGVGQTGKWMNKSFEESFNHHADRARKIFPKLEDLPDDVQAEIIQLEYRGDTRLKSGSPAKWTAHIKNGKWEKAAEELLDHDEYEEIKDKLEAKGQTVLDDGVTRRLYEASEVFKKQAKKENK